MLEFSVKKAVAFLMSFWQWMQTLMTNMATDLQDIALLDVRPVKYFNRRGLVRNLGDGVGMISMDTSQDYPSSSQPSLLVVPCEMQLQKYEGL